MDIDKKEEGPLSSLSQHQPYRRWLLKKYYLREPPCLRRRWVVFSLSKPARTVKEYEENKVIVCERNYNSPLSKRILDLFKIDSIVRVSPLHCHGLEDVNKFLAVTKNLVE